MKKILVMLIVAAVVVTVSVGAYAHYTDNTNQRGGWNRHGHTMQGRGSRGGGWKAPVEAHPCGEYGHGNTARPGWRQSENAPQLISEEKVKEIAETYVNKYFSGYSVEKIEQDSWRPMFYVTIQGENEAELQLVVRGFDGQVMHIVPKTAE